MTTTKPNHIGRKIARIRELRGMKQEALAHELGISQQSVSHMEQSENVEEETLIKVSEVLKVSPEAIRHFSEEAVFNIINNTFQDNSANNNNYFCTIDPVEKIVALYEEKEKLYERLVQAEKDKVSYLEALLKKN
ncbi:helix-turn-helix domain-containing protein [Leeuwenhoekiella palythoae]|uniref:helix-turn-helix domain-containing protein n=1 Tax=Leeuwenhoekiella palythoae TaxID=573501 RepID=UPI001CE11719|nr:helix-turn-helix transcriptional regulator [Leeuwenhoekiella palythoae]UBZ10715.1 helix-turn-helix domain-containing protein [Leeuwenhoekiella palythoae]